MDNTWKLCCGLNVHLFGGKHWKGQPALILALPPEWKVEGDETASITGSISRTIEEVAAWHGALRPSCTHAQNEHPQPDAKVSTHPLLALEPLHPQGGPRQPAIPNGSPGPRSSSRRSSTGPTPPSGTERR